MIDGENRFGPVTVASYRRRHQLAEEVPGLYIRRLTLEDPRSAQEPSSSRSQSPTRHICHPTAGYVPSSRRSSRYSLFHSFCRNKNACAILVDSPRSLELLDLLHLLLRYENEEISQFLNFQIFKRFSRLSNDRSKYAFTVDSSNVKYMCPSCSEISEAPFTGLNISGPNRRRLPDLDFQGIADCICSEISENFRVNVAKKKETRESRSPSPEMTHIIRIAMNYHDQLEYGVSDEEEPEGRRRPRPETNGTVKKQVVKEDGCCNGVNDALNFTLNCCSVRLTSRGRNAKTGPGAGKQQRPGTRN
ncbi:hypothetical protein WN55_06560 [Dufourea novaeangliae]|uniref:Uncharacterized protein n=1 Tax=Dufourea novaeangliae TaxID=178035 RepID=A0A154PS65_DUFNO|nr:hypothetical protein WN55_06560 [Dufourea novaeangliae]